MKISNLLKMPIGQKVGGFDLNIKTHKKVIKIGDEWFQKVCLIDKTGDILADVNITTDSGGYNPLNSQRVLHITVCEVQESDDGVRTLAGRCGKKLLVLEHTTPNVISWDDGQTSQEMQEWHIANEKVIMSKIRCLIVAAHRRKVGLDAKLTADQREILDDDVDIVYKR